MGGKALLFVILGFSITFLLIGNNYNRMASGAVTNMSDYANKQISHSIAVSGANLGCNALFMAPTWSAGYSNLAFQGGTVNVTISTINASEGIKKITSISSFAGYHDTVAITFQPSRFSKFAYYSADEGGTIYWATGDTIRGPVHTQDYFRVSGKPYFFGKVTTKLGLVKKSGVTNAPTFAGGFATGVDLPINLSASSNLEAYADVGGYKFTGNDTVYLTFITDSVQIKYKWNGPVTTGKLSVMAPNGVIYVKNATARIKGTVQGQYTIGCSTSNSIGGSIYLDGDLVYKTNPVTTPSSTDILGVVAQKNIWVTNNKENNTSGINLNGSFYSQSGSFTAQNYDTRGYAGYINLVGGIIQSVRGAVGQLGSSNTVEDGFNKNYRYDTRFMFKTPPNYPNTGSYEILSWYE